MERGLGFCTHTLSPLPPIEFALIFHVQSSESRPLLVHASIHPDIDPSSQHIGHAQCSLILDSYSALSMPTTFEELELPKALLTRIVKSCVSVRETRRHASDDCEHLSSAVDSSCLKAHFYKRMPKRPLLKQPLYLFPI